MRTPRWLTAIIILSLLLMPLTACQSLWNSDVTAAKPDYTSPGPGRYFDFPDVRLPDNMQVDRENSFVYQTDSIKAGMINMNGHVPIVELLGFFERNMPTDGWDMLSTFKYQKNIQLFTKPDKVCMVIIKPPFGWNKQNVEIWVAPIRRGTDRAATVVMPITDDTVNQKYLNVSRNPYLPPNQALPPTQALPPNQALPADQSLSSNEALPPNQALPMPAPPGPYETLANQTESLPLDRPLD